MRQDENLKIHHLKRPHNFKDAAIRLIVDFSIEMLEAKGQGNGVFMLLSLVFLR